MIDRTLAPPLKRLAGKFPIVTLTGPRQSGKTTLCRAVFADKPYVSFEAPNVRESTIADDFFLRSGQLPRGLRPRQGLGSDQVDHCLRRRPDAEAFRSRHRAVPRHRPGRLELSHPLFPGRGSAPGGPEQKWGLKRFAWRV
jgi:hypothetical protein